MAITSGFFDSVNGDRKYTADQISNYFEGILGNGVIPKFGNEFKVTAVQDSLSVNVGTGRALVKSHWIKNDAPLTLELAAADLRYDRYDRIILGYDRSKRAIDIYVKTGTASANPQVPSIIRGDNTYELSLAKVKVLKNATKVSSVATEVPYTKCCGYVTGLVEQVDTSVMAEQFEAHMAEFDAYMEAKKAAFDKWFKSLTETLNVDTSIAKYEKTTKFTAESNVVIINDGMNFNHYKSGDVLLIHMDGRLLSEEDYRYKDYSGYSVALLNKKYPAGTSVNVMILKSEIGGEVLNGQATAFTNGNISAIIGEAHEVQEGE